MPQTPPSMPRQRRGSLWLLFAAFYLLPWLRLLAALLAAG